MKQITQDRLRLLSLGYEPLASVDKGCYLKDRNNLEIDESLILSWDRKHLEATGLRTGILVGIDLDIEDPLLLSAMRGCAFETLGVTEYIRIGKPPREMLCYTIDGDIPARKQLGAKYQNGSGVAHRVEVYGSGFYIGAFGKHSEQHQYHWPQASLLDADIDDLPVVTAESLDAFMAASSGVFRAAGMTEVVTSSSSGDAHVVRDMELDDLIDGSTVAEWMTRLSGDESHRCSAVDFRADAGNETSMVLQLTDEGHLTATDHPHDKVYMLSPGAIGALEERTYSAIGGFVSESDSTGMFETTGNPMDWLLSNIVTMIAGGYYDLSHFEYMPTSKVLDAVYGHHARITIGTGGGVKRTPPSGMLATDSRRLVASGMCWQPCRDDEYMPIIKLDGHKMVNTFEPPDIVPVEGDVSLWLALCHHICGEHTDLVLDHMAYTVTYPARKIAWQVLIHGVPRTGKTMMFEPMTNGLGSMAGNVSGEELKAGWGDVFSRKKVLLVEEVYGFGRGMFNLLKTKFTNSGIERLNIKGEKQVLQANLYSMYMLTNHADAFEMDENEDKLLGIKGPAGQIYGKTQESEDFYNELGRLKESHAYQAAVLHYLLGRDISRFKYGALPVRTSALVDMAYASKAGFEHALWEWDADMMTPFTRVCVKLDIVLQALHDAGYRQAHRKGVVTALQNMGYESIKAQKRVVSKVEIERYWARVENLPSESSGELYDFYQENPAR